MASRPGRRGFERFSRAVLSYGSHHARRLPSPLEGCCPSPSSRGSRAAPAMPSRTRRLRRRREASRVRRVSSSSTRTCRLFRSPEDYRARPEPGEALHADGVGYAEAHASRDLLEDRADAAACLKPRTPASEPVWRRRLPDPPRHGAALGSWAAFRVLTSTSAGLLRASRSAWAARGLPSGGRFAGASRARASGFDVVTPAWLGAGPSARLSTRSVPTARPRHRRRDGRGLVRLADDGSRGSRRGQRWDGRRGVAEHVTARGWRGCRALRDRLFATRPPAVRVRGRGTRSRRAARRDGRAGLALGVRARTPSAGGATSHGGGQPTGAPDLAVSRLRQLRENASTRDRRTSSRTQASPNRSSAMATAGGRRAAWLPKREWDSTRRSRSADRPSRPARRRPGDRRARRSACAAVVATATRCPRAGRDGEARPAGGADLAGSDARVRAGFGRSDPYAKATCVASTAAQRGSSAAASGVAASANAASTPVREPEAPPAPGQPAVGHSPGRRTDGSSARSSRTAPGTSRRPVSGKAATARRRRLGKRAPPVSSSVSGGRPRPSVDVADRLGTCSRRASRPGSPPARVPTRDAARHRLERREAERLRVGGRNGRAAGRSSDAATLPRTPSARPRRSRPRGARRASGRSVSDEHEAGRLPPSDAFEDRDDVRDALDRPEVRDVHGASPSFAPSRTRTRRQPVSRGVDEVRDPDAAARARARSRPAGTGDRGPRRSSRSRTA